MTFATIDTALRIILCGKLNFQDLCTKRIEHSTYCAFVGRLRLLVPNFKGISSFQSPSRGWENDLRRGFLHGVSLLIDILSWMQGMDIQIRQGPIL